MNRINPKKLLHSKWTATEPKNKEKHFVVTGVNYAGPESDAVESITLEAVRTGRTIELAWRELKLPERWRQGWV